AGSASSRGATRPAPRGSPRIPPRAQMESPATAARDTCSAGYRPLPPTYSYEGGGPGTAAAILVLVGWTSFQVSTRTRTQLADITEKVSAAAEKAGPQDAGFEHAEGNSDSHIKTTLVGPSVSAPVRGGKLSLGTWQGIFLCEWDGPRTRTVEVGVTALS